MNIWRLVAREILHRKLSFALGVLSVVVAVGCLMGQLTLLDAHDLRTEQILAAKQAQAKARLDKLEDDYRKIMKEMGFNILILPADQDLSDFWHAGYATKTMPAEYVERLANSRIMTIRHLLPILEQKVSWPEQKRRIILIGTRGEAPLMHRDPKRPILVTVPPGEMVMGYELWSSLGLKVGDKAGLLGKEFTIGKCHSERGSAEDITIWIDLTEAQKLLGMEGRISVIEALKCHCPGVDVSAIRREIAEILPGTQIRELASKATARAKARDRASMEHERAIAAEKEVRSRLRHTREEFAAYVVPLVIVGCTVWIGLLAFGNVRQRRVEIGILRAIGLRSRQIFSIFLSKALLVGLLGACLGYALGFAVGAAWGELTAVSEAESLFRPWLLLLVLIAAPTLTGVASWVPATIAATQDPSEALRQE